MANARQELKELAKAIDIITGFRSSAQAAESELVMGILNDAELSLASKVYGPATSDRTKACQKGGDWR